MQIIYASENGQPIPANQIEADRPKLLEMHRKACVEIILWSFFGGTLTIPGTNRVYQVA